MDNHGENSPPILPDKAIFVQCVFLSDEPGPSVGCAIMTTVEVKSFPRTEPYHIMIPLAHTYAKKIERIFLVIDGELVEAELDEASQSCV